MKKLRFKIDLSWIAVLVVVTHLKSHMPHGVNIVQNIFPYRDHIANIRVNIKSRSTCIFTVKSEMEKNVFQKWTLSTQATDVRRLFNRKYTKTYL